jgi:hypothetical protein
MSTNKKDRADVDVPASAQIVDPSPDHSASVSPSKGSGDLENERQQREAVAIAHIAFTPRVSVAAAFQIPILLFVIFVDSFLRARFPHQQYRSLRSYTRHTYQPLAQTAASTTDIRLFVVCFFFDLSSFADIHSSSLASDGSPWK